MDRVFLDANVLFSAAYKEGASCAVLWTLAGVELMTSNYAIEEARRNLPDAESLERLRRLVERLRVVPTPAVLELPRRVSLPDQDQPILAAALAGGATHLVTGDLRDFGPYLGLSIGRLRIVSTRDYVRSRLEVRPRVPRQRRRR